jgi:F0F1-type ATP synthase membrane subunit b/b'
MINKILLKSLSGWNKYLTGPTKQRIIGWVVIGAICGFTQTSIQEFTGNSKQEREQEESALKETEKLVNDLKASLDENFKKEVDDRIEEMRKRNEQKFKEDMEKFNMETDKIVKDFHEDLNRRLKEQRAQYDQNIPKED